MNLNDFIVDLALWTQHTDSNLSKTTKFIFEASKLFKGFFKECGIHFSCCKLV